MFFVSHCILNRNSKVEHFGHREHSGEDDCRKNFIKMSLEKNIGLIQLPCPEFSMYGSNRWGHTKNQFDNPFYRKCCREMLQPVMMEIEEYMNQGERFKILGIVGVNGSPSCGIDITCTGHWGGEISSRDNLTTVVHSISKSKEKGVFMEELKKLLEEHNLDIPEMSLSDAKKVMKNLK